MQAYIQKKDDAKYDWITISRGSNFARSGTDLAGVNIRFRWSIIYPAVIRWTSKLIFDWFPPTEKEVMIKTNPPCTPL